MPRYFFHLEQDGERIVDEVGSTYPILEAAQAAGLQAAGELAADDIKRGVSPVRQFIIVEDEGGLEGFRIRVEAAIAVEPIHPGREADSPI